MLCPASRSRLAAVTSLWPSLLLLFQGRSVAQAAGESFAEFNMIQDGGISSGPLALWLVVAVATGLGLVLALAQCLFQKMRKSKGTYQPRKEEQTGARNLETPNALKLPKEERLI
ncbi:hypothetical protein GJAV_G00265930 [Gymnothorax javanicus]|nr:hypothetical protein GJAV_G00265930 [Gymnothorax javanicus]